jgi:hypothetical protein
MPDRSLNGAVFFYVLLLGGQLLFIWWLIAVLRILLLDSYSLHEYNINYD